MTSTRTSQRLSSLGEFGWLKSLIPRLYWPSSLNAQRLIGAGDDAGVVRVSPGKVLVATTDAMVEGIHFERRWFPWKSLGAKVLSVNLSDLAAMGDVKPLAALVTAGFPGDTPVDAVDKFYKGLENGAKRWKIGLLGGDTVGSKKGWFVSVTVFGEADPRHLIQRKGARPGDYLVTTGYPGQSGAGLEVLQSGKGHLSWTRPLVEAFSHPQPRFAAGRQLGRHHWATSLMDCSDGVEASARLLSEASEVGIEIDLARLPLSPALVRWANARKRAAWTYALSGGEDYELIFTVAPHRWPHVQRGIPGVTRIGQVLPKGSGCWALSPSGKRLPLKGYGFSHFQ